MLTKLLGSKNKNLILWSLSLKIYLPLYAIYFESKLICKFVSIVTLLNNTKMVKQMSFIRSLVHFLSTNIDLNYQRSAYEVVTDLHNLQLVGCDSASIWQQG